jgi:hypothetical protein
MYKQNYYVIKSNVIAEAHACNSSYSGDRDQEDHSLRPAQAKNS